MAGELVVENAAALAKTLAAAGPDFKKAYRADLRNIATPTQVRIERLALTRIRRMRFSPQWTEMRIGVTQKLVYIVPRQKGSRGRGRRQAMPRRRRSDAAFGQRLAERAMEPAAAQQRHQVEHDFEDMLDRLVVKWDHDGP